MKSNVTQSFRSRSVSMLLAAVMVLLCFGVCPVRAEGSVAAAMYTANYDPNMGFVSGWDGALVQSSNGMVNTMPNNQTATWGNWSNNNAMPSYDNQQQVEHITLKENGSALTVTVVFDPTLRKDGATKLVVGARASRDIMLNTYYSSTNQSDNEARRVNFVVNKSDDFREYVITGINWGNLTEDIRKFRITFDEAQGNNTIDFAYIRFVDDSYKGLVAGTKNEDDKIENGAVDYDESDQIVDFAFPEDLKLDTVTADNIKINGSPVHRVTTANESKKNIRVDLGTLSNGTKYTVSFPGIQTESGKSVDDFTFTTIKLPERPITPIMYKADTGIKGGWENNAGGTWTTKNATYNYDSENRVAKFAVAAPADNNAKVLLTLPTPLKSDADKSKLVICAKSDTAVENVLLDYRYANDGSDKFKQFKLEGGNTFVEYVFPCSELEYWHTFTNGVGNLLLEFSQNVKVNLEIKYIRLMDDTCGSASTDPINSGAVDYDKADQLVDFDFGEALNESSVNSSGITINGAPVRWAMILPEKPNRIRVNLGKLREGTEYTVSFSGLQTEDGYAVTDSDFTFTTTMPQLVDGSVTLHKAAPQTTGVVGGWEGTSVVSTDYQPNNGNGYDENTLSNGNTTKWADWGNAVESYSANMKVERITLWPNTTPTILNKMTPAIAKSNAAKLVIGAKAASDIPISLYVGATNGSDLYSSSPYNLNIVKSDDIREYVIDAASVWSTKWSTNTTFGYMRMDTQNSSSDTTYMDIAYIRLVNDDYTGPLSGDAGADITPEAFTDTFDAEKNSVFDLVFDHDLDLSTVTADAVTFNGKPANWVMTDPANKRRVRVCLGALTPLTRGRLTISGVDTSEGERLKDMEFRFTTAAADVQTGELPVISTFELVENYAAENETPVAADADLSGKTVTAVAGGLYNNKESENSYMLMLARYDEKGNLEEVSMNTYALCGYESLSETGTSSAGGTNAKATKVEMTVPSDGKHTVKAFAWNLSSLMPLSAVLTRTAGY